jgi:hypothetical protein
LIVWLVLLLGSSFDFAINVIQVCLILHILPWAPHIGIIRSRMKKGNSNALVRTYTHKVCFENVLKNPELLDMRSRSDLIQDHFMPQLPKMVW